jgi:hypothetical protein
MMVGSDIPRRIAALPQDQRGYPVPWFVATVDGVPDFRVIDPIKLRRAVTERRCFICGNALGKHVSFVIGPMCAINRVSSEPPSHHDCAVFAAKTCPFLVNPQAPRRETNVPEDVSEAAGLALKRNPGVALVWNTLGYTVARVATSDAPGAVPGILFNVGEPEDCEWYAEGRPATRAEVLASFESGVPLLLKIATEEGPEAVAELDRLHKRALGLLPEV